MSQCDYLITYFERHLRQVSAAYHELSPDDGFQDFNDAGIYESKLRDETLNCEERLINRSQIEYNLVRQLCQE